jgi:hypothetical protein
MRQIRACPLKRSPSHSGHGRGYHGEPAVTVALSTNLLSPAGGAH